MPASPASAETASRRRSTWHSLRLRLTVIPAAILGLGLAVTIGIALHDARPRVEAETNSGMRLGRILVDAALANAAAAAAPGPALARLQQDLPQVRHVRLAFEPDAGQATPALSRPNPKPERPPRWFARLVSPTPTTEAFAVMVGGRRYGRILMVSNPLDEADEIWNELGYLTGLLGLISTVIVVAVFVTVTLALRPLRALGFAFDRLEHGLDVRLEPIRVAELSRIPDQFNSLAGSLRQVTEDNHRLIDRLISGQEADRREIAHELHDEFGPSLFGIRAELACIVRRAAGDEPPCPAIREHARTVATLVDGIQRINYRLLDRLRPLILDELGLAEALVQLVESWRQRMPEIAWSLRVDANLGEVAEPASLTLYRAVQECLTNAARHANPAAVDVALSRRAIAGGADELRLMVSDDGGGLAPNQRFGFGLLGICERARALHGALHIGVAPGGGAAVEIVVAEQALQAAA